MEKLKVITRRAGSGIYMLSVFALFVFALRYGMYAIEFEGGGLNNSLTLPFGIACGIYMVGTIFYSIKILENSDQIDYLKESRDELWHHINSMNKEND